MDIVIQSTGALTPNSAINALHGIEHLMSNLDQVTPSVEHYFGGGTYCRTMTIEPDVMVSGRMHREATVTIVLVGEVTVASNHGAIGTLHAGEVMVTPARTKRLWYSLDGAVLMTVHANPLNTHNLQELEDHVCVPVELEAFEGEA
jgi:hypothetical protein